MDNIIDISIFTNKTKITQQSKLYHRHMCITNGNMYISDSFAKEILNNYDTDNKQRWFTTLYGVSYNYDINFCYIQLVRLNGRHINGYNYKWRVTGVSGNKGFDETYYSKRCRLDLRILNKIHKKIISLYFDSKVSRYDKIKKLLNEKN